MVLLVSDVNYRITISLIEAYFLEYRLNLLDLLKKEVIKTNS